MAATSGLVFLSIFNVNSITPGFKGGQTVLESWKVESWKGGWEKLGYIYANNPANTIWKIVSLSVNVGPSVKCHPERSEGSWF